MFADTVEAFSRTARGKVDLWKSNKAGALVSGMLAGFFIGLGMALIYAVGAPFFDAHDPAQKLVMGASFGIALSLVLFAGSDLFTGNTMVLPIGAFRGTIRWADVAVLLVVSWVGNLLGSLLVAALVAGSGALAGAAALFDKVAVAKMAAPAEQLVLKGILCNVLVCLAVWTGARAQGDAAKLILIWWCLFGFIGTGYEHSVANMSLLAMMLFTGHSGGLGWDAYFYNLGWVTLGNLIAGTVFLAAPYLLISRRTK